jgi:hypothetical protein
VAVRPKVKVCSRAIIAMAGSNPAELMDMSLVYVVCYVGSGLCDELIIRS